MCESASKTVSYQMTSSRESNKPANGFGLTGKNTAGLY